MTYSLYIYITRDESKNQPTCVYQALKNKVQGLLYKTASQNNL